MVKVFITNGCLGCRKAIKFFQENNIEFSKKDFSTNKLTKKELIDILSLTSEGFNDILSVKSKDYKSKRKEINDLTINQMINLIINTPMILSRPICLEYDKEKKPFRLLVGYNANDIEIFLRKDHKKTFKHIPSCGFEKQCGALCGRVVNENK